MDNSTALRSRLIAILATNSDRPEHTVDDIMELFCGCDDKNYHECPSCNNRCNCHEQPCSCCCEDELDAVPCPTCGDVNGMVNPCCPDYDPLHFKNCGTDIDNGPRKGWIIPPKSYYVDVLLSHGKDNGR